jgi:prepilin-type N-terminal cleavage/methylation domain-containing protein
MIIVKMKRDSVKGFTLVELMIATTVFSVVLLLAMTGFFQIGRIFYKGVSITQTQDVANQIGLEIGESIEGAPKISPLNTYKGLQYICIGKNRYTIDVNRRVDVDSTTSFSTGQIGLVKDTLNSDNSCVAPCLPTPADCASGDVPWNKPTELLGDNMRVESFNIASPLAPINNNYYAISLIISYGDDDLLTYTTPGDRSTVQCKNETGSQFCAVGRYSASINRGVGS